MKKYLLGLTAMAFIAGTFAFTEMNTKTTVSSKKVNLYWYHKSPATGNYSLIGSGAGPAPTSLCPETEGAICALGFTQSQSSVNDGMADDAADSRFRDE